MKSVLKTFGTYLLVGWYVALVVMGVIIVRTAMTSNITPTDPTGEAGLMAALMALLTGLMALTYATINVRFSPLYEEFFRRGVATSIALGLCAGAYFWISSETSAHPSDPNLQGQVAAIVILAFGLAAALVPFFQLIVATGRVSSHLWNRFVRGE